MNKVVVIRGGAQGIGRCIAEEFQKAGTNGSMLMVATSDTAVVI